MANVPTRLTLYSYQVGFGDCFLLRFSYPDGNRHALIDFGTTGLPEHVERDQMVRVAKDIQTKSGGRLEVVVATHRHADHISGFAPAADGTGPGDIIRSMDVGYVVQPWTEAPDEEIDSLGPQIDTPDALKRKRLSLSAMHAASEAALNMVAEGRVRAPAALKEELSFIGRDNLSNRSAVDNLIKLGRRRFYAYHGMDLPLDKVLPGVATIVLGPPTLRQSDEIRKQRRSHAEEYWHMALKQLGAERLVAVGEESIFPGHPTRRATKLPTETRWFSDRVDRVRAEQLLGVVRALDKQMNNTSLILLFEVGKKLLLFPGDAQIENWSYALHSAYADRLANVDLYKVGHHGSLNATPKGMWAKFRKRNRNKASGRLVTIMSTMPGKHGSEEARTEVPRTTLLRALQKESDLHSTHLANPDQLFQEVKLDLT